MDPDSARGIDRRRLLGWGGSAAAGMVAAGPPPATARPAYADPAPRDDTTPDALFMDGRFTEADRGYARILREDPKNAHAAGRRGEIALLSNRFTDAERFLTTAIALAPDDKRYKTNLGDCYVRQDRYTEAAPLHRAAGAQAYAEQLAAIPGTPYQIHGPRQTRVPWKLRDPRPAVEAVLNGGRPRWISFDTGAGDLSLTRAAARELGLRAVAKETLIAGSGPFTAYYGVLESLRLGDIELRDIPVGWGDRRSSIEMGVQTGGVPGIVDGLLGTRVLYHFLATMDYAGRAMILRRKSREQSAAVRAGARRAGAGPLPLWLTHENFPVTLGSVNGYGPRPVLMETAGNTDSNLSVSEETVTRANVRVDRERPRSQIGGGTTHDVPPCYPDDARIGDAAIRGGLGFVGGRTGSRAFGFDIIANFTHNFYKPYAVTFDFQDMRLYITGDD